MKMTEELFPADLFIRIHKSFIVSIKKISAFEGHELQVENHRLPVSKHFRAAIESIIKEKTMRTKQ